MMFMEGEVQVQYAMLLLFTFEEDGPCWVWGADFSASVSETAGWSATWSDWGSWALSLGIWFPYDSFLPGLALGPFMQFILKLFHS